MAVYLPTFLVPSVGQSIDFTQSQNFSAQVNGLVITHYQIRIYNNSTNALLYDIGKLALSPNLYDKQILSHTVPANSVTNGLELKWTLQVWENTSTVTSREIYFKGYGNPTFSVTIPETINSKTYEFVGVYSHPQNVNIKRFQFKIYDSSNNVLENSGDIYSANTKYKPKNISFINGNTYKVEGICEDINGVIVSSGIKTFSVDYPRPSLSIVPDATVNHKTSGVIVKWSKAIQKNGTVVGTYSYVNNFISQGNKGLLIDASSNLSYMVDIPKDFTVQVIYRPEMGFTSGIMVELDSSYKVGYEQGRFYFKNNGTEVYSLPISLPSNLFMIVMRSQDVLIIQNNIILSWLKI